jgi:hypothetical protein
VFERASEGILHGLIRRNSEPLGSPGDRTPHLVPLPMFDELQGEERDRAAESDMTVAKPRYSPKLSASEGMKLLRSTIPNPRGSTKQSAIRSVQAPRASIQIWRC